MYKKIYTIILLVTSFLLVSFSFLPTISLADLGPPHQNGLDLDCVINGDLYYAEELQFVGTASGGESPYNFKWSFPDEEPFWVNGTSGTSIQYRWYYPTTSPTTYNIGLYAEDKNGKNQGLSWFFTINISYDVYVNAVESAQLIYRPDEEPLEVVYVIWCHSDYYTCPYLEIDFVLWRWDGIFEGWVETNHDIENWEHDEDIPDGNPGRGLAAYEDNPGEGLYKWEAIIDYAPYDEGEYGPHSRDSDPFLIEW